MTWECKDERTLFWEEEEKWLLEFFKEKNIDSTLCTCCGLFRELETLKRITGQKITGLDYEQGFIDYLKDHVEQKDSRPYIAIEHGDVQALPFDDETFDLTVTLFSSLTMIPNVRKAITSMLLATKPGGFFVTTFWKDTQDITNLRMKIYCGQKENRAASIRHNKTRNVDEIVIREDNEIIHSPAIFSKEYISGILDDVAPESKIKIFEKEYCYIYAIRK